MKYSGVDNPPSLRRDFFSSTISKILTIRSSEINARGIIQKYPSSLTAEEKKKMREWTQFILKKNGSESYL